MLGDDESSCGGCFQGLSRELIENVVRDALTFGDFFDRLQDGKNLVVGDFVAKLMEAMRDCSSATVATDDQR